MSSYNRYQGFEDKNLPFIELRVKSTDKYINYKKGVTRFDKLSFQYYQSPEFGFLINLANPEFDDLEYPDDYIIRIPFPLAETLAEYEDKVDLIRIIGQ